jgi:hypothetical protein
MGLKSLPPLPGLIEVATRVIWFEPPEAALTNAPQFLAYLMTYGTAEDVAIVRRHFGGDAFREALDGAPPGIFDERSWAYWNIMADRYPPPPMPKRVFDRQPEAKEQSHAKPTQEEPGNRERGGGGSLR